MSKSELRNSLCYYIGKSSGYGTLLEQGKISKSELVEKSLVLVDEIIDSFLLEIEPIIKSKKLPVPNPYGTTVRVTKYNQIMDDLIEEITKKLENK